VQQERSMSFQDDITMAVESEVHLPVARLLVVQVGIQRSLEYALPEEDTYRLDLSLTPRPPGSQACYRQWGAHRYERVGSIFVMPPNEPMAARTEGPYSLTSLICLLQPEPLREWFDGAFKWSNHHLKEGLDIRDDRVRGALQRLAAELRAPGLASNVLLGSVVTQLAVDLGRYCTTLVSVEPKGGLAGWRMRLIDERLYEPTAAPTLQELAQLCKLSVRALTQGFRQSKGVSIGEYVTASQVEHAKRLLMQSNSVKAAAYTLGFSSSASFCYSFKRSAGETPGQYLARLASH
jgi:AraC family transcriptional regulator